MKHFVPQVVSQCFQCSILVNSDQNTFAFTELKGQSTFIPLITELVFLGVLN